MHMRIRRKESGSKWRIKEMGRNKRGNGAQGYKRSKWKA